MLTIDEAVKLIRDKYEDNKDCSWIHNPVAYTLYEVWKITDSNMVYYPSGGKKPLTPQEWVEKQRERKKEAGNG